MKYFLIILVSLYTTQSQAFVKCVNSDGHIQYGDKCTFSNPVKNESMYIEDTYDPESAYQAEVNNRELDERTRQDSYEREKREVKYRKINARQNTNYRDYSSSNSSKKSYRSEWGDRRHCIYSCKKDPRCIAGC